MATHLPSEIISHTRKVQNLYKRAVRELEAYVDRRDVFRYRAVLLRKEFDDNKNLTDMRVAKQMVADAEQKIFLKQHWHPRKFPESPGGVAYERKVTPPDWVLDCWHPMEKARYPEYFARREQRKKEYIKFWQEQYGKIPTTSDH